MKKLICGIILGSLLMTGISYAYRIPKPQRITEFNHNGLVILNESLEQLWDLTNGRYNLSITTSNPDGVVKGNAGDMILLLSGGVYYLEVCTGSNVWVGEALSNTP
jgi:hypothetical protein